MSCTSTGPMIENSAANDSSYEIDIYRPLLYRHTRHASVFNGLYNEFDFHATQLTSEIKAAQIKVQSEYSLWSEAKTQSENLRVQSESNLNSTFFLSFFTPSRQDDNLHTTPTSWKIYMVVENKRYEGSISKYPMLGADINRLFPFHGRWSTPYLVTFRQPMTTLQTAATRFIVTGPLGQALVDFNSVQK